MANTPIVDFSAYSHKIEYSDRTKTVKEVDEAFRNVGFVYLKKPVQSALNGKFFALPLDTKIRAPHPPGGSHHCGCSAPGLEKVSQHTYDANELNKLREVPDHKESFESGNTTDAAQPNTWLPEAALPGFRDFMESFFGDCSTLIHRLLDALSVALSLDNSLSSTHSQSHSQLRLLHYPSLPFSELAQGKRSRINAHSGFGTLTLLFQDSGGGLEVEDPQTGGLEAWNRWKMRC